jgi:lysophospholipase
MGIRLCVSLLILLQAGSDSIVHPVGHGQFCSQLKLGKAGETGCGGENGRPVVVAGARHELFIEEDRIRTDVLTRILSFFDRLRNGRADGPHHHQGEGKRQ